MKVGAPLRALIRLLTGKGLPTGIKQRMEAALTRRLYHAAYGRSANYLQARGMRDPERLLTCRSVNSMRTWSLRVRALDALSPCGTWEMALGLIPDGVRTVMDIGCSARPFGLVAAQLGYAVTYADIGHRDLPGFQLMDLNRGIDAPDGATDFAVAIDVVEHLENTALLVREMRRISRAGFLVTSPNPSSLHSRRRFARSGELDWFGPGERAWHVNPVFPWQMRNLAATLGCALTVRGSCEFFFPGCDAERDAESLLYLFAVDFARKRLDCAL